MTMLKLKLAWSSLFPPILDIYHHSHNTVKMGRKRKQQISILGQQTSVQANNKQTLDFNNNGVELQTSRTCTLKVALHKC